MQNIDKAKTYVKYFIEIAFIALFGLIGLVFIFVVPFCPPKDRHKSLPLRVREAIQDMNDAIEEVFRR